jgi:hypothetical protein
LQFLTGILSDSRFFADLSIAVETINSFIDTVGRERTSVRRPSATVHTLYVSLRDYDLQCREAEAEAIFADIIRTTSPSLESDPSSYSSSPNTSYHDLEDLEEGMGQNQIEFRAIQALACNSCEEEYLQHGIYLQRTYTAENITNPTLYVDSCFV